MWAFVAHQISEKDTDYISEIVFVAPGLSIQVSSITVISSPWLTQQPFWAIPDVSYSPILLISDIDQKNQL